MQRRTLSHFLVSPAACQDALRQQLCSKRDNFSLWFSRAQSTSLPEGFCLTSGSPEWQASHRCGASDYANTSGHDSLPAACQPLSGPLQHELEKVCLSQRVKSSSPSPSRFPVHQHRFPSPHCALDTLASSCPQRRYLLPIRLRLQLRALVAAHTPVLLPVFHRAESPPRDSFQSQPVNVTLLGNRVFAGVIQFR